MVQRRRRDLRSYTKAERSALVAAFDERKACGLTAIEAAEELSIPLVNIYRWKSKRKEEYLCASFKNQGDLLAKSIESLYNKKLVGDDRLLEALFVLVGWLRSSSKPQQLKMAVACLFIAYGRAKYSVETIDELPSNLKKSILRYIRLQDYLEAFCLNPIGEDVSEFPYFFDESIDDQPYDDRDELARMCWCLLALGNSPKYGPASLGKTIYLLNSKIFKYNWSASRRTKEIFWKLHGAAAPFVYVERFHSPLDLGLDPQDPDFLRKIDHLLADRGEMGRFLGKVRATVDRLNATLDARSLATIDFPRFPDVIQPCDLPLPQLTGEIIDCLRSYKSAER